MESAWRSFLSLRDPAALTGRQGHPTVCRDTIATIGNTVRSTLHGKESEAHAYILDFLGLKDTYAEKDIEAAILREMESFILELGVGFCFVGLQGDSNSLRLIRRTDE